MKKELLIFISGIIVGIGVFYFIKSVEPKIKTPAAYIQQDKNQQDKPATLVKSKTAIDTPSKLENTNSSISDSDKMSVNTPFSVKPVDEIRSNLIEQIQELPDYKVKWVKEIVDQAKEPPVNKIFESELRDPDRAIGLEDKLLYDFHEGNSLNGRGRIESLECRSRYCKARIALPSDDKLNGAQNFITSFPGVVLTSFTRNTDENSDENFTDVYIDTQPDSTRIIKLDDGNNP